jgi:hypothetical protein
LTFAQLDNRNPLSFLNLNIRSIPKNIDHLSLYLDLLNISFSFIGITETWLNENSVSNYGLNGYSSESFYRKSQRGGGVTIFIRENIPYIKRDDLNIFGDECESVFIEIDKSIFSTEKNIVVGVLYRVPNKDVNVFNKKFNKVLNTIKSEDKLSYCLGDYNINLLNYDSHHATNDFVNLCFSNGFVPVINKPTRVTRYSATIIDNIITNDIINVSHIQGLLNTDISDHFPSFLIHKEVSKTENITHVKNRTISMRSMNRFNSLLHEHSFADVMSNDDASQATSNFIRDITFLYNQCFPIKTIKKKYLARKPWLSSSLRESIRRKNILYRKYLKCSTSENEKNYKLYRNKLHSLIKIAERQHYQSLISINKNNLRKSWSIIKEIINKKKTKLQNTHFIHNNRKITDNTEIASMFNDYFINVGNSLANKIPTGNKSAMSYFQRYYSKSLFLKPTNASEINSWFES